MKKIISSFVLLIMLSGCEVYTTPVTTSTTFTVQGQTCGPDPSDGLWVSYCDGSCCYEEYWDGAWFCEEAWCYDYYYCGWEYMGAICY